MLRRPHDLCRLEYHGAQKTLTRAALALLKAAADESR
jgi:hypothetical protein